jgi:hypothetical protein
LASDYDNVATELPAGRAEVRFIVAAAMGAHRRAAFSNVNLKSVSPQAQQRAVLEFLRIFGRGTP